MRLEERSWQPLVEFVCLLLFMLALASFMGCATKIEQRPYFAGLYRAYGEAAQTAVELRRHGIISDSDWPGIQEDLKDAKGKIDEAWSAYKQNPDAGVIELLSREKLLGDIVRKLADLQKSMVEATH